MQKSPQFFNQSEQALRHYSNKILILNLKNANKMNVLCLYSYGAMLPIHKHEITNVLFKAEQM